MVLYPSQQGRKSSKLFLFSPFVNSENFLCVGCCLKFANIPLTSKNQIIVSKSYFLARLIIADTQRANFSLISNF